MDAPVNGPELPSREADGMVQTPAPPGARPLLTVVMPLHNGADWLRATLDSLARETEGGFEVIAIDSSPDDRTCAIAEQFAHRFPLQVLRRPDVAAWPTKTNMAVKLARTDHVCMLHQDDLWLPGRMTAVRRWIQGAPDAALHLAPSVYVNGQGKRLGSWTCPLPSERNLDRNLVLSRLLVQNFISVPAPVIRRQAWIDCGGMEDALWYTADWDIWLKLAAAGPVVYHHEFTTAFRIHGSSLTMAGSRNAEDFRAQMEIVLDRYLDKVDVTLRRMAEPLGRASIDVNVAMAAASRGGLHHLAQAIRALLALGPKGITRYFRASRLHERVFARIEAKLGGGF